MWNEKMRKTKVLIVDDSAVVRKLLSEIFSRDPSIEVSAAVADPIFAQKRMAMHWPDVIVLDVEMPRMDGITFLRKIMEEKPTPVVMCSTLTAKGAETTMQAMSAGAVDIIMKPKIGVDGILKEDASMLLQSVKAAAKAKVNKVVEKVTPLDIVKPRAKLTADVVLSPPCGPAMAVTTEKIIAIGTSTGGTQALESILTRLPQVSPGIVVVQHMPEKFTAAFASRLNSLSEVDVKEAKSNDRVIPGRVLIAPGGRHMVLKRSGAKYYVEILDGPVVSRHRPSVDVLFRSVAKTAGSNALGIIMTGMGDDGASGLLEMHQAGASTIGQDEQTCIVYGMPKEAAKRGAVDRELPLGDIPRAIVEMQ